MSLQISDKQRVTLWEVEDKGKYHSVKMSSGRKDKETDKFINSNWSFVRFVGDAHKKLLEETPEFWKKQRVVIKASISLEEYVDDAGNRAWPKNPKITVFNFEIFDSEAEDENKKSSSRMDTPPQTSEKKSKKQERQEEDLPF